MYVCVCVYVTDVTCVFTCVLTPARHWQSPDELGYRNPTGSAEKPQRPTVSHGDRSSCYSNGFWSLILESLLLFLSSMYKMTYDTPGKTREI